MEKIVVGIDGSETGQQALEWAVAEARLRGTGLIVVHTWQQPTAALMSPYGPVLDDHAVIEESARQTLTDSLAAVDVAGLVSEPEPWLVQGSAAPTLLGVARKGALLVVGSRGRGGFAGLLLGSVSRQVAHEATVPVVIIPPAAKAVDSSSSSQPDG